MDEKMEALIKQKFKQSKDSLRNQLQEERRELANELGTLFEEDKVEHKYNVDKEYRRQMKKKAKKGN